MSDALLKALSVRTDVQASLDFETYYDREYTLKKLTTEAYVRDPRFEVIGVGVKWGASPSVWLEEWEFREWAKRVDWSRVALNAHHAQFDGFILSEHYGIRPGFWYCTMSMGRVLCGMGALEKLGPLFGVGEKGKELENSIGKRRRDFTQAEWLRFGDYCNQDVAITDGLLTKMGEGFPPLELWLIDTTIRMFTEPVFRADLDLLRSTLATEREKKARLLKIVASTAGALPEGATPEEIEEAARAVLSSSDKFAALLRSMGEEPPTKPNPAGKQIFAFAKSDPGMQALTEHPREEIRDLAEARLAVKSTIIGTRTERLIGIAERGAVPFYLKYCGAHTHRWSGGDKMNPQNFNRGGALRAAIEAPPGHVIVVADSGQIEARVLPWLAGQADLLETFRRNDKTKGDFYSDEGSRLFKKQLSKKDTPVERQSAKSMILGLGFGMGWQKFAGEQLKGMLGAPPVQFTQKEAELYRVDVEAFAVRPHDRAGATCGQQVVSMRAGGARLIYESLLIHCAVADYFVRTYRATYGQISGLWRAFDSVLHAMASGSPMTFGCLRVIAHGIVKPSGLTLTYPGLRKGERGYSYLGGDSGREPQKAYGGLITENVVQSLARDIVAEQALWVRAAGYPVATTTHDEIVCVVPEAQGEACLKYMIERMRIAPAWCADLPLNAEGGIARSYGAAK